VMRAKLSGVAAACLGWLVCAPVALVSPAMANTITWSASCNPSCGSPITVGQTVVFSVSLTATADIDGAVQVNSPFGNFTFFSGDGQTANGVLPLFDPSCTGCRIGTRTYSAFFHYDTSGTFAPSVDGTFGAGFLNPFRHPCADPCTSSVQVGSIDYTFPAFTEPAQAAADEIADALPRSGPGVRLRRRGQEPPKPRRTCASRGSPGATVLNSSTEKVAK
jgi:hypothetical protein